ncbi:MAG: Flp pilus assembly complex ATPase component TadA [Desulfobulbaceae bacterium]|nr:Flp pilus assembly complex ATPase component TadA [Desulfobulbaceae bacterium]
MSQPSQPDLKTRLAEADLYFQHGLKENAEEIYREILAHLPPDHSSRAAIEQKIKSTSPGASAPVPVAPLGSEPEHRFENCLGLIEAGFYADAIDELKVLLDKGYRRGAVHAKIGECLLANDEPHEALKHLNSALSDHTISKLERLDVLDQLASTYEASGSVQEAINALKTITATQPDFRNAGQRHDRMVAMVAKFERFYHLYKIKAINEEQFDRAKQISTQRHKDIEKVLTDDCEVSKQTIGESIAEFFKCQFVEFNELEVGPAAKCLKTLKENFWRANNCIPIREDGKSITIASLDPNNPTMLANLRSMLKGNILEFAVCFPDDLGKFIDYYHGKMDSTLESEDVFHELEMVEEVEAEGEDREDEDSAATAEGVVVKLTNRIIEEAFARNASDIHVESQTGKRGALVRFRVDGECSNFQTIPFNYKKALVSRIKIISKLDIAEKRMPQDGKIKFRTRRGKNIELRVATLPTVGGNEDVVMRILAGGDALPLKKMGLLPDTLETFKGLIERPYGLVLVVGPTGSGKTTTLHAGMGYINRPEKKIWTAEDPVEIVQDGLRQVQVLPKIGLDFARVLRAFLRADPDVIMVGETRDQETANTVIEAALTGHLVFSTLHTNSAPETVTRLLGMGIDPFNFADSLLGVLAQRLIKRLCPHCRQAFNPSDEELEIIRKEYGDHPVKPLEIDSTSTLYRARGCSHCQKTGYKGRLAIHELLVTNDNLRSKIESNAPVAEIRYAAMLAGMRTLKQDGIRKVMQGDTDMKQVCAATNK